MGNDKFWKRFEKSGRVEDYLEYACTSESSMSDSELDYVLDSTFTSDDRGDITISDVYADEADAIDIIEPGWDEKIEIY